MRPPRGRRHRHGPRQRLRRCGYPAAVATAALATLIGACTISSESPDASSLSGRAGPSSGTTTTSGAAEGAPTPGGSSEQEPAPGEATAAGDTGGDTPDEPAASTEDGTDAAPGEQAEDPTGDPAGTGAVPVSGEPTTDPPDETTTDPPGGTTPDPPDSGAESGGEAPQADAAPDPEAAGTPTVAESAFDERSKVSTVGIGSVYFGMSPEESAERVGTVWEGEPAGGADCYVITPANGPPGVALWVYHGTVERVDIDTPLLRTQSGLGVGTHLGELQSRLGEKLVVGDHPYLGGWTLATFVPTDPNDAAFRIAFDISGGEVIRFRAGRTEIVALESCA